METTELYRHKDAALVTRLGGAAREFLRRECASSHVTLQFRGAPGLALVLEAQTTTSEEQQTPHAIALNELRTLKGFVAGWMAREAEK